MDMTYKSVFLTSLPPPSPKPPTASKGATECLTGNSNKINQVKHIICPHTLAHPLFLPMCLRNKYSKSPSHSGLKSKVIFTFYLSLTPYRKLWLLSHHRVWHLIYLSFLQTHTSSSFMIYALKYQLTITVQVNMIQFTILNTKHKIWQRISEQHMFFWMNGKQKKKLVVPFPYFHFSYNHKIILQLPNIPKTLLLSGHKSHHLPVLCK